MSSSTIISTFGAPAFARSGRGQAGLDSSAVRPITPEKVVPGSYSFSGMVPALMLVETEPIVAFRELALILP